MTLETGLDEVEETYEKLALHHTFHRPTIGYNVHYIMDHTPQLSGVLKRAYSRVGESGQQAAPS